MSRARLVTTATILLAGASLIAQESPVVDHHQHLFSPPWQPCYPLIGLLDAAGIKRAVVLSPAYIFEPPSRKVENADAKVRADNDWISQQVAQYPGRLVGFCGLNPLKDYALEALARCAKDPNLRNGVKLHFGNSVVDYHNADHIAQVARVFRAANGYRMPIVVHMRAAINAKLPYGRDEARIFLEELVPAAPDVVIQVAHLAAAGAASDPAADEALEVFIDAIANGDPRATRLYFALASVSPAITITPDKAAAWEQVRTLPLTAAEIHTIATNVAPYLR